MWRIRHLMNSFDVFVIRLFVIRYSLFVSLYVNKISVELIINKLNHPTKKFLNPEYSLLLYRILVSMKTVTGSYFKGWESKRRCLGIGFVSKVNLTNVHVRIVCLCSYQIYVQIGFMYLWTLYEYSIEDVSQTLIKTHK